MSKISFFKDTSHSQMSHVHLLNNFNNNFQSKSLVWQSQSGSNHRFIPRRIKPKEVFQNHSCSRGDQYLLVNDYMN